MDVLTIIPAKIGSTRLPRKNILPLAGEPLINWTIKAALQSGECGTIMVSTESLEIAEVAKGSGAEVPFLRPEALAVDPYGVVHVCEHVLLEYEKMEKTFQTLVVLLPTSPFRTEADIRESLRIFKERNASFVSSVSAYESDVFAAHSINDNGLLDPIFPDLFEMRPHLRPVPYEINGAVMVADVQEFLKQKTLCGKIGRAHV